MNIKEVRKTAFEDIENLKDVDEMFSLCITGAFFAGSLGGNVPIDETRKVFKKIKELLKPTTDTAEKFKGESWRRGYQQGFKEGLVAGQDLVEQVRNDLKKGQK